MNIINLVFIPLFIVFGLLLLFAYIKYFILFYVFSEYLFSINDTETLRKIGRLNALYQKTWATVHYTTVHKALQEKYLQTNNKSYCSFDRKYMRCMKQIIISAVLLFLLYVLYQILMFS